LAVNLSSVIVIIDSGDNNRTQVLEVVHGGSARGAGVPI